MDIVVEFWGRKSPGVECNRVQFAIGSCDENDSGKCIVRGISLNCNLSVQNPMGKDQSCGESLFKCFKGIVALIREKPGGTLVGKTCKWNCDFGISINEARGIRTCYILAAPMDFHDSNIAIHSDNTAIIDAFSNGKSHNHAQNNCLC